MNRVYCCCFTLIAVFGVPATVQAGEEGPDIELPADEEEPAARDDASQTMVGGYGEMHFNRVIPENGEKTSEIDFHRMVIYLGKQYDDKLSFHSELEIEHSIAGEGKPGEVALEQAYVDYQLADALGVRAGIVLVPMGIINQVHEPPTFHGVERPNVDKVIIPSTWREGGAGIYGRLIPSLRYELYVLSGLDPTGFSAKSGVRGGRLKVGEARTDGLAIAGRIEYQHGGASVFGLSGYLSQAGKNSPEVQSADLDVGVIGVSADARMSLHGVEARAVFALFGIGDSDELNALLDEDGEPLSDVGSTTFGFYAEAAYDVLSRRPTAQQLLPFARVEYYQTHPDIDVRKVTDLVFGLTYRPARQVSFKGDVILRNPKEGDSATIINLGVGFLY